jgi:hypothetical protein
VRVWGLLSCVEVLSRSFGDFLVLGNSERKVNFNEIY